MNTPDFTKLKKTDLQTIANYFSLEDSGLKGEIEGRIRSHIEGLSGGLSSVKVSDPKIASLLGVQIPYGKENVVASEAEVKQPIQKKKQQKLQQNWLEFVGLSPERIAEARTFLSSTETIVSVFMIVECLSLLMSQWKWSNTPIYSVKMTQICGKKCPPYLQKKTFNLVVPNLEGYMSYDLFFVPFVLQWFLYSVMFPSLVGYFFNLRQVLHKRNGVFASLKCPVDMFSFSFARVVLLILYGSSDISSLFLGKGVTLKIFVTTTLAGLLFSIYEAIVSI